MDDWRPRELELIVRRLGIAGRLSAPSSLYLTASDGLSLHALDWGGSGPLALLLHGGGLTARTWDYVCVGLRDRFRLVALDQRGHGESGWSDDYSMSRFGRDAVDAIEAVAAGPVHLVGMSLGGVAAAEAAAQRPDLVCSLAIVDVAPGVVFEGSARMRGFITGMIGAPSVEAVVEAALRVSPKSDPERVAYRMGAMLGRDNATGLWVWKRDARRMMDFPHIMARVEAMAETLEGFDRPMLLVRGGRSTSLPRAAAEAFTARLTQGRLAEIEGAGHNVQEDQPAALIAALAAFWAVSCGS